MTGSRILGLWAIVLALSLPAIGAPPAHAAAPHKVSYADEARDAPARLDIRRVRSSTTRSTMTVRVRVADLRAPRTMLMRGHVFEEGFEVRIRPTRNGYAKRYRWCYVDCSPWKRSRGTSITWDRPGDVITMRIPAASVGIDSWFWDLGGIGEAAGEVSSVTLGGGSARDEADRYD